MNLIDNFIFQYFTDCKDVILNGVSKRDYLFDTKFKFPGCLANKLNDEKQRMIDSLKSWDVCTGLEIDDREIYTSIKTFLTICSRAENKSNKYKYRGITQSMQSLLSIVCLNNPSYISYEKYNFHITQSEIVIKFILSLFRLDYDAKIFAFGGSRYIYCQYENDFGTERDKFISRQLLIGSLTDSPALSALLYCMRMHRNYFAHSSSSDSSTSDDSINGSELHTYIINRNESIKRLQNLLIDYVTVFYFLQKKIELLDEYEDIRKNIDNEAIKLELVGDGNNGNIGDYTLSLQRGDSATNLLDNLTARIKRFYPYTLTIHKKGEEDTQVQLKIDHTYTQDVKAIISFPPGQYTQVKPEIKDLFDVSYLPECKAMEDIWVACNFEDDIKGFIDLAKQLVHDSYRVNKEDIEQQKKFKEKVSNSITHLYEQVKKDGFSDALSRAKEEISALHKEMIEAINDDRLEDACAYIEASFMKMGLLKTNRSNDALSRIDQLTKASANFLETGDLDLSNIYNDSYIKDAYYMTILNVILQDKNLGQLYLLKDRLGEIIDAMSAPRKLAIELYNIFENECDRLYSQAENDTTEAVYATKIIRFIIKLFNSDALSTFFTIRCNFVESYISKADEDFRRKVRLKLSELSTISVKNEYHESVSKEAAEEIKNELMNFSNALSRMPYLSYIARIEYLKHNPGSGSLTDDCDCRYQYENESRTASDLLQSYINSALNNLAEFDCSVINCLWYELHTRLKYISTRSEELPQMLKIDENQYDREMDALQEYVRQLEACYAKAESLLKEELGEHKHEYTEFEAQLLGNVADALQQKLKANFSESQNLIFDSIIDIYRSPGNALERYMLYNDLNDLQCLGDICFPIAIGLRTKDLQMPISFDTYNKYHHVLYVHKDVFLNPEGFGIVDEELKWFYLSVMIVYFRNAAERIRILDLYGQYPESMDAAVFLDRLSTDVANSCFFVGSPSQIYEILTLADRIGRFNKTVKSERCEINLSKIRADIRRNASALVKKHVHHLPPLREATMAEKLGAMTISDKGNLDKLLKAWECFGAHNMSIKSFYDKESLIFDRILRGIASLYENGDKTKAGEYASKVLEALGAKQYAISSMKRFARFKGLESYITEGEAVCFLENCIEHTGAVVIVQDTEDLKIVLKTVENIYKDYCHKIKGYSHHDSAYAFAQALAKSHDLSISE